MSSVVKAICLLVCLLCYWIEQAGGYRWPTQSALEATIRGDWQSMLAQLRKARELGASIDALSPPELGSVNLLMLASFHAHPRLVRALLKEGARPHIYDAHLRPPLMMSLEALDALDGVSEKGTSSVDIRSVLASSGNLDASRRRKMLEVIKLLVDYGGATQATFANLGLPKPAPELKGTTGGLPVAPMQLLAGKGRVDQMQLLIDMGVPHDKGDIDGVTPLQYAATYGHINVCKLLLSLDAALDFDIKRGPGKIPLTGAAAAGHAKVVDLLARTCSTRQSCDLEALLAKRQKGGSESAGRTALMVAASRGHSAVVKILLKWGADVNAIASGEGLQGYAEEDPRWKASWSEEVIPVDPDGAVGPVKGWTSLAYAAELGYVKTVKVLLQHKNIQTEIPPEGDGRTVLARAVLRRDIQMVEALVKGGCNIKTKDEDGLNACELAAGRFTSDVLVQFCSSVDIMEEGAEENEENRAENPNWPGGGMMRFFETPTHVELDAECDWTDDGTCRLVI